MISSTQRDLQGERDAVGELIHSMNHEALRAETYNALGLSPEQICTRMAEECHLYMYIRISIWVYSRRMGNICNGDGV